MASSTNDTGPLEWAIRVFPPLLTLVAALLSTVVCERGFSAEPGRRPNFIIFFADDMGYGDIGCYGAPRIKTPNFDHMAAEGTRFTDFYVQPVCGVSRAALMTGCYPIRVAEAGNTKSGHPVLHTKEITVAEVLKDCGYRTALVGKWHLAGQGGNKRGRGTGPFRKEMMPNAQGFDYFYGTPLHNGFTRKPDPKKFVAELMRNDESLEAPTDMDMLTQKYTTEAVKFITDNKDRPFLLYLAHNMPHVPLGASKEFRGKSKQGLYGDVIQELDWSCGQVMETLKKLGIDEDTLVIFTSDNGPWVEGHLAGKTPIDNHYGSADPLRGAKMMTYDGGIRTPCIMRWPGHVPAGRVCRQMLSSMDLFPSLIHWAGGEVPKDRIIDGRDARALITGAPAGYLPRDTFFFYCFNHLQAVRHGKWKLVLPRPVRPRWCSWSARMCSAVDVPELYDMEADPGEKKNLAKENPEVVAELMKLVEAARKDLGDYNRVGEGARFFDEGPKRPDALRWQKQTTGQGRGAKPKLPARDVVTYDNAKPVGPLRFDFESGDLQGWKVVEGEFDLLVSDRKSLPNHVHQPFNKQGKYHLSTLERKDGSPADAMTGEIESPRFKISGKRISFLIGGGQGGQTYVALCNADGKEIMRADGTGGPAMRRVNWDVGKHTGQTVYLRIVDRKTAGWGHVTFDDFSAEGERE